jgi:acetylornithine deacetylase/succinyl-diaminopimelate desuccinylase-like protein
VARPGTVGHRHRRFLAPLARAFSGAEVLVTGVEDPHTRAHGPNESLHLRAFQRACLAEALLLDQLAAS